MTVDFSFLLDTTVALAKGVPTALKLVSLALLAGAPVSILVAMAARSRSLILSSLARGYVFMFRGTPLLVQIFVIYYGVGQFEAVRASVLWPVLKQPFWCAILALALNTGAYGSEIVRGAIGSIPPGQIEAARSCGMTGFLLVRRVIAPIALRIGLPIYGNEVILMIKATSLASTITLMEITGIASELNSETFRAFEVFGIAGAFYLSMNFVAVQIFKWLEHAVTPERRPPQGAFSLAPSQLSRGSQ